MVYLGTVRGGVVEFEGGNSPPDGAPVRVEVIKAAAAKVEPADDPLFSMTDLAVDTGISDLATNIDHYLYSAPRADANG
jgi:hypothetical protein